MSQFEPPKLFRSPATRGQHITAFRLLRSRGVVDRTERLNLASTIVGRSVGSFKDLTSDEIDEVIDALDRSGSFSIEPSM